VLPACRWAAAFALLALTITPHPPARRAVIYIQPGSVSPDRQWRHCFAYCQEHGIDVVGLVRPTAITDAVAMVADGEADLVVSAFAERAQPEDLRSQAADAGVPVEYVRPPVLRRELAEAVVTVWKNTGRNVDEAARLLGLTTRNVRAALERLGIRPNGGRNTGRNGRAPDSRE
jgi:hypothetical protein